MTRPNARIARRLPRLVAVLVLLVLSGLGGGPTAHAEVYKGITGSGSTWSQNAIQQWVTNVRQYGMSVNYSGGGSSTGRQQFTNGTVDFAVSEIPFGIQDGASVEPLPGRKFAYMPIVAGGTSIMYNLVVGGRRVTSLRLSGDTLASIFAGLVTSWDDPAIKADNPSIALPAKRIVPVVRADGSGTTAQFTAWMLAQQGAIYRQLCAKAGRNPCTQTSNFPALPGFVAKADSAGVAGFVRQAQNEGSITYVEYSYAKNAGFPVAKVLNAAGYYVSPTAQNVAVGLLGATINTDQANPATYLTQKLEGVYRNPDARAYPLSSYSYMILPTGVEGTFTADKGKTLGAFGYYFLCTGQQNVDALGYSPLPKNLVEAGFDQVRKIPGVNPQDIDVARCNNPTFSPSGENLVARNAPQPPACDKKGAPAQCDAAGSPAPAAPQPGSRPSATAGGGSGSATPGVGGVGVAPQTGSDNPAAPGIAGEPAAGEAADPAGAALGGALAAAPILVPQEQGWRPQYTLMALTGLTLLALVVAPALLLRDKDEQP